MPKYYKPLPRFYLQPKGGEFYIFLSFRYSSQRLRLPIGVKIKSKKHWDTKRQRISTAAATPDYRAYDGERANDRISRYEKACNDLWDKTGGRLSIADFRHALEASLGITEAAKRLKDAVKRKTL